jgi:hypothetical protein
MTSTSIGDFLDMDAKKIALTSHDEFEDFQDLAYDAFKVIESRRSYPYISIFKTKDTNRVLSQSWIRQIISIVSPIKANEKARELVDRLKGIISTTNYYLGIYQRERNISTLLRDCRFKPSDIQFKVVFSPTNETVEIDLPEEYAKALGEAYRLLMAILKGDYDAFVSFLDEYGTTPYDKDYLRLCFQRLEEFPRSIDKDKPDYLAFYEKLFLKEAS